MASYILTIYSVKPNQDITLGYNSNNPKSTESATIEEGKNPWTYTLQDLSYSKAIYKPGELIFKLQITGCSGVNAIYSTFKGKKVKLTAQADNHNIAKDYYIFGIQIEKKGNVYYTTFQAYDPFKFLTLDTYCKAYTGKKFIWDIFWNTDLWPNNLPTAIKDTQFTDEKAIRQKAIIEQDKLRLEGTKDSLNKQKADKEKTKQDKITEKETEEKKTDKDEKKIEKLDKEIKELDKEIEELGKEIKELETKITELKTNIESIGTTKNSVFNRTPQFLYYFYNYNDVEFIQPYLVQYNESFFDFLVRVSNRCGEFLYYEDGYFNIGWKKKTKKDQDDKEQDDITPITEYVSVNFSDETTTAWKKNFIVSSHHNYPVNAVSVFPNPIDEAKLSTKYKNAIITKDDGTNLTITYDGDEMDPNGKPKTLTATVKRSDYAINPMLQDSHLASDENLVSLPPKGNYTKWEDFALWPGCFWINAVTDIANSANIADAITNVTFNTITTSTSSGLLKVTTNNDYEDKNFKNGTYTDERKNGDRIHPFSTSEVNKNTALNSYVTFSLEFYEAVRKGIEANERARIQIALGTHFYPLSLGSLINLDGQKYIVVQMSGCASSGAEALDIEAIPYVENTFVFPPAAPVSPIREAKAQRAFITHNTDPLKMNRVRVRYPWQGETESVDKLEASEDSTPWIRIALPMASDGSGFNFLPQIGDEAIINYENGNIEKPYVEGMLYTRAEKEDESTVPYAFKRDKARVISSVNGHSIIFYDPAASLDVFNSLTPMISTIKSFVPSSVIKAGLKKVGLDFDLPDSFRKALGGIEFTDENGFYSISMSSDKRAISIDSPLGKVDINAFTGITISAPNGNVRIEGKNIDIVAGNNLSISSGNNINTDFWPTSSSLLKEAGKDLLNAAVLKKIIQPIDMGLIRTVMETLIRPIGGTMLIKSNRYLCIEAGKGEAKIPGRNLQLHGTALWNGGVKHKETVSFYGDLVSAYQYINDLFNTCKANAAAIAELKRQYDNAQPRVQNSQDFNQLFTNIRNNTKYTSVKDERNKETKAQAKLLNKVAKRLYKLVNESLWDNVKKSLQKSLSAPCKTVVNTKDAEIKTFCQTVYFINANTNAYNDYDRNAAIDREALRSVILNVISGLNTQSNKYGITINNLPAQIANTYDQNAWNALFPNAAQANQVPQAPANANQLTIAVANGNNIFEAKTTGKTKALVKAWGLNGLFDQYNWDHASGGDILFSRKEGQTLYLDNTTINEYTLGNKMQQIIDFLKTI